MRTEMASKFTKNPSVHKAFIPGVGWIQSGHILEGDEYARFAPDLLVEIPDKKPQKPLESEEPLGEVLIEPAPSPIPEQTPQPRGDILVETAGTSDGDAETESDLAVSVKRSRPRGPRNALRRLSVAPDNGESDS